MNLLKETIEDVAYSKHNPEDIVFIGTQSSGHSCTWDEFCILADRDYDNNYGYIEVALNLIIVFSDGSRLFRDSYDGSEWWGGIKKCLLNHKSHLQLEICSLKRIL